VIVLGIILMGGDMRIVLAKGEVGAVDKYVLQDV
jgi:hypothetical protein